MNANSHIRRVTEVFGARRNQRLTRVYERGQAMVETALLAVILMTVLLVGIQLAIIGQAALAVSQASYLGARTASVNESLTSASLETAIKSKMSPTISATAQVTLTPGGDASCTANNGGRGLGCPVNVTVTYNAKNKIFFPTNTFFGMKFPTNLTATESAMTE